MQQILGEGVFLVNFCDYGDILMLSSGQLKLLPAHFRELPKLAISAKLFGK